MHIDNAWSDVLTRAVDYQSVRGRCYRSAHRRNLPVAKQNRTILYRWSSRSHDRGVTDQRWPAWERTVGARKWICVRQRRAARSGWSRRSAFGSGLSGLFRLLLFRLAFRLLLLRQLRGSTGEHEKGAGDETNGSVIHVRSLLFLKADILL